jgi:hypothetical protein
MFPATLALFHLKSIDYENAARVRERVQRTQTPRLASSTQNE